jgi:D-alanyl-D-alanine carboxypeptidase
MGHQFRGSDLPAKVALVRSKPFDFAPGAKWEYSNTNYELLGAVIARVSGMSYEQYVRTNLFAKAGMAESAFVRDESALTDMATGYSIAPTKDRFLIRSGSDLLPTGPTIMAGGAGAIVSTAHDLAKWDSALFGGRIVSAADLSLMTSPGPRTDEGPQDGYGFGWSIEQYDDVPRVSHSGASLGFTSSNQVYPAIDEYVIVLLSFGFSDASSVGDVAFDQQNPTLAARQNIPEPGETMQIRARVQTLWSELTQGTLDRNQLTGRMNKFMTPALVAATKSQYARLGRPTAFIYRGKAFASNGTL